MDYVYDIVLNFHDTYYEFYEWKSTDKIINVKKIPIYKVSTKDYLNIKNNDIIIDSKTLLKTNKIFLITSGFEIIGLYLDSTGKVLKKSSLIFEESDDILEDKDLIKSINIKYQIIKQNKITYQSRINKEKSKYLKKYFKSLDKVKDEYLLKYIYYDIYNIPEEDSNIIYKKLQELLKKDLNKIYDSIKRVNHELNLSEPL